MNKQLLIYAFLILLLYILKSNSQSSENEVHYIIDATLNGTSTLAQLDLEKGDYIYFSYDFNYHSEAVPDSKDIAYFYLSSEANLIDKDNLVSYGFSKKDWTNLKSAEELKDIEWKKIESISESQTLDIKNYYYKITRVDNEMKTLILRVPKNGKNKGDLLISSLLIYCEEYKSGLRKKDFQKVIDGKKTDLYVLTNKNGYEVAITNYGGHIAAIMVPDKDGNFQNVVQGHDSIDNVINSPNAYLSTLIGRYGNRISNGTFSLDGKEYKLNLNDGKNHLHGGPTGFHARVWDAVQPNNHELKLMYVSKDGEENYPGTLALEVVFSLNDQNEFKISYRGKTDKKTVVNMTHHMLINLLGVVSDPCPLIEDHILTLNANWFLPTDSTLMPTGEIASVNLTPFDFRKPKRIGDALACENDPNIILGHGVDHNFVLNKERIGEMTFAGKVFEPTTKRFMEIYTTEPGMQVYSANFHDGFKAAHGIRMPRRSALAFETQHFPDSPNIGHFPSVVLKPGEVYVSDTIYKFGVEN